MCQTIVWDSDCSVQELRDDMIVCDCGQSLYEFDSGYGEPLCDFEGDHGGSPCMTLSVARPGHFCDFDSDK